VWWGNYHGTRADLKPGDLIEPGYHSNYGSRNKANHVYLTATVDAAVWGAELAVGEGPGNSTKSYRARDPLRVTGELTDWEGHSADVLQAMKDNLARLDRLGIEAIDD
jgi:rifampin ADP-ribosylating transferase